MATAYMTNEAGRKEIGEALNKLVADTYVLYMRTHGFHWNVVGPRFVELHKLFEEQYTELHDAADIIAERTRALGERAPTSFAELLKLATISEASGTPKTDEMIRLLAEGNRAAAKSCKNVVDVAEKYDDVGTADLATGRIELHEKAAWMLESLLEKA